MDWARYYVFWFVAPIVLGAVTRHPWLAAIALVGFLSRRWLPDPFLFFKYSGRVRTLRHDIAVNAHNAAARRELALIYLEKKRPANAVSLLQEALQRQPDSPEMLYNYGLALMGAKRWREAIEQFIAAVSRDPRVGYGDPYLRSGEALVRLGRLEDATEGFEHAARVNGSSVEARYRLGVVLAARGDRQKAKAALTDARTTYRQLPAYQKRKSWGWALRAWWKS